jgi:16S rRNA processing protein RimM
MALVGRIARPHGLRGHVLVNLETDFPEERFRPGRIVYVADAAGARPLTIDDVRFHQGRPIVGFAEIEGIDQAESLRHGELRAPLDQLEPLPAGNFYRHDLVGCDVITRTGAPVGRVSRVEGPREGSRLVIGDGKNEVLIPLAADICVEIDTSARRIVIEPPEGLLELNR